MRCHVKLLNVSIADLWGFRSFHSSISSISKIELLLNLIISAARHEQETIINQFSALNLEHLVVCVVVAMHFDDSQL